MNPWIILSAALALLCAALIYICVRLQRQVQEAILQAQSNSTLRQDFSRLKSECARWQRDSAALQRALQAEQERADDLQLEIDQTDDQLKRALEKAECAEHRRIETEKEVYAEKMRVELLERQIERSQQEFLSSERLYQNILQEQEQTIARLQDQQKRRTRRKPEVLEQQISINDLLDDA